MMSKAKSLMRTFIAVREMGISTLFEISWLSPTLGYLGTLEVTQRHHIQINLL